MRTRTGSAQPARARVQAQADAANKLQNLKAFLEIVKAEEELAKLAAAGDESKTLEAVQPLPTAPECGLPLGGCAPRRRQPSPGCEHTGHMICSIGKLRVGA